MPPYPNTPPHPSGDPKRRLLAGYLRLLLEREQHAVYSADEGRVNLSSFRECPEVAQVIDSIDFNSVSFCQCLCEAICATVGGDLRILHLDSNGIRGLRPLVGALVASGLHISLRAVSVAHNSIDSFDPLTQLRELPNLQELQLDGNPIAIDPQVRLRIRRALPQLLTYNREPVCRPPLDLPWPVPASDSHERQGLLEYLGNKFVRCLDRNPNRVGASVVDSLADIYHQQVTFTLAFADPSDAVRGPAGVQPSEAIRDVNGFRQSQLDANHNLNSNGEARRVERGKVRALSAMGALLYPEENFDFVHVFSPVEHLHTSFVSSGAMSGGVRIATATLHGIVQYQHRRHSSLNFKRVFHRTLVLAEDDDGRWLITNDTVELRPVTCEDAVFTPAAADRCERVAGKIRAHLGHACGSGMTVDAEGRYEMGRLLAEGNARIVEARDTKTSSTCAIKVFKTASATRCGAREVEFTGVVGRQDPSCAMPVGRVMGHFVNDEGHMCIVMPQYGLSTRQWVNTHGTLKHHVLSRVVFYAACALDYLHSECRLIHAAVEPAHLLFDTLATEVEVTSGRILPAPPCKVRLCNFGKCHREHHTQSAAVSSRSYRAPEVVLGRAWSFSADMWSFGCTIYELHTGSRLFDGQANDIDHLHLMAATLRLLPTRWAAQVGCEHVFANNSLLPATDPSLVSRARRLNDVVQDDLLRDLLHRLLDYNRATRLSARAVCTHPYMEMHYPGARASPLHPLNRTHLSPVPSETNLN